MMLKLADLVSQSLFSIQSLAEVHEIFVISFSCNFNKGRNS